MPWCRNSNRAEQCCTCASCACPLVASIVTNQRPATKSKNTKKRTQVPWRVLSQLFSPNSEALGVLRSEKGPEQVQSQFRRKFRSSWSRSGAGSVGGSGAGSGGASGCALGMCDRGCWFGARWRLVPLQGVARHCCCDVPLALCALNFGCWHR